tara:strand:+ start:253 stop:942 length:690 start_codon:yes stop_codon:yes gene_type:complete
MTRTNEKIDQTYKGSLKSDPDRNNPRHGLACEYLFNNLKPLLFYRSRYLQLSTDDYKKSLINNKSLLEDPYKEILEWFIEESPSNNTIIPSKCIEYPLRGCIRYKETAIKGWADVYLKGLQYEEDIKNKKTKYHQLTNHECFNGVTSWIHRFCSILGEVKITPEPAEKILQQITFYREIIGEIETYIVLDFDCPQLIRMTQGSNIHVKRLGNKFEEFCNNRPKPQADEL